MIQVFCPGNLNAKDNCSTGSGYELVTIQTVPEQHALTSGLTTLSGSDCHDGMTTSCATGPDLPRRERTPRDRLAGLEHEMYIY